jgi:hypothetical protein
VSLPQKNSIPYYDQLIRLAVCQRDLGNSVNFRFDRVQGSERETVIVYPVSDQSFNRDTLPLFNFYDLDPLQLWVNFGYAEITSGSLQEDSGTFALTPKTLNLKLVREANQED